MKNNATQPWSLALAGGLPEPSQTIQQKSDTTWTWFAGEEPNETIVARRRRQDSSSGPSSSQRADAPARHGDDGGTPPSRPSGSGSSSGGKPMPLWLAVLVLLVVAIAGVCKAVFPDDSSQTTSEPAQAQEPASQQVAAEEATPAKVTRVPPTPKPRPPSAGGQTWTVMLYEDADDQILEEDMYIDVNEAERAGSTDQVNIVAQIDRYKGAFKGDGNWSSTRRYHIEKDQDLKKINSPMIEDLGETNMADGNTLVDFVTWAAKTYPADKYVLILSDHGMGWPGGWSDADAPGGSQDNSRIPMVSNLDDNLYLMELDSSLGKIQKQAGIKQFELIGMDACLMGHLEVFSALQPYARYAVASQETEPALGWAYTSFLQALQDDPGMDGAELSRKIVSSYITDDQRIVDPQAREAFLRASGSQGSSSQVAKEMSRDVTLTAANLSALSGLNDSVNSLVGVLQDDDQSVVADARTYAQSFTNVFGKKPAAYIDLGNFVQILKRESKDSKVQEAADQVLSAVKSVVVAEKHGAAKKGATGISIYFPNSTLYRTPIAGAQSYTGVAKRFAEESLWDDFLAFHYNDVPIQTDGHKAVVPGPSAPSRAPGAGQITVSAMKQSAKTAAPGKPVRLSADIRGQNIGYIYLFVGYIDQAGKSVFIADKDYLESPETREVDGVFYPVWSKNKSFTLALDWDPTIFTVTDGEKSATVLLTPTTYGATGKDTVYTVDGIYHYADGQSRQARLYFQDGTLRQVFGFTGENDAGAPREILPQPGDTFTVLEQWLDLDSSGKVSKQVTQEGEVLTFGDQPFRYEEVYAAAGPYIVGFMVDDMDGNTQEVYARVTVQ